MNDPHLLAYQHAIRRCLEPLINRRNGRASADTVQRFVDRATGAAIVYASNRAELRQAAANSTATVPNQKEPA